MTRSDGVEQSAKTSSEESFSSQFDRDMCGRLC